MKNDENRVANDARPRRLLHCGTCSRSLDCAPADLLRYTREGWPRCCGQVMALFTETAPPGADDTKLDRPPLPP